MANLECIRELAEEPEVECQSGLEHDYATCAAGCKNGYVSDPLLAPLLEVVTVPVEGHYFAVLKDGKEHRVGANAKEALTRIRAEGVIGMVWRPGRGRVIRNVQGWPEGAVAGMLMATLAMIGLNHPTTGEWAHKAFGEFGRNGGWTEESPDQAACEVVIDALEGRTVVAS